MTVKEMSQLYYLNREIVQLERQLEELECLAESTTQVITGMPHGSGTSDKVGRFAVRIADLRSMIGNRKARCWDEMNRLNAYIDGVEDSLTRQILSLRYVNGLSWQQVADSVGGNHTDKSVSKICYRYLERN